MLDRSKKLSHNQIKAKLRKAHEEILASIELEAIEEIAELPSAEEPPEAAEAAPVAEAAEEMAEAPQEEVAEAVAEVEPQPEVEEAEVEEEALPAAVAAEAEQPTAPAPEDTSALYDGTVELTIPPPVGLDRMLQLHKHLRSIPQVEVLNLGVSADKGITIRLLLQVPTPLIQVLGELPEVESVQEAGKVNSGRQAGKAGVRKFILSTKK